MQDPTILKIASEQVDETARRELQMKKLIASGVLMAATNALADEVNPGPDAEGAAVVVAALLAASAGAALLVWLCRARSRNGGCAARGGELRE